MSNFPTQPGKSQPFPELNSLPLIDLAPASTPEAMDLVRTLFQEYASDPRVDICLAGFASELAGLPGDYAPPSGRLLIARVNGHPAGCAALRPTQLVSCREQTANNNSSMSAPRQETARTCELKRLFVKPEFRGLKLGRQLVEYLIREAALIGYQTVTLHSLPFMSAAIRLYESAGFVHCRPPLSPHAPSAPEEDHTVFMELQLPVSPRPA